MVSGTIRDHIRGNLVGYIALFVALGGTAMGLPGKATVDSGDIKNSQVKLKDLAPNSVDAARILDGSITGAELANGAVTGQKILDGTLGPADIAPDSLGAGAIAEAGLTVGGALTGTLGAAGIAPGAVGADQLADGAVVGGAGGDVADGSITNADVATNAAGDLTGANIDEASLSGVNAATLGGNAASDFLGKTSNVDFRAANKIANTATAADGTKLIGGSSSRFTLEATGVPHTFKLCDELGVTQHFLYLTEANNWVGTASTIPGGGCTANLPTGGVSNTAAGAMIIFAPNAVLFIGPATQNALAGGQDPQRYSIESFGFAADSCGVTGASC
jgi:hypothetical protein